jgi:hypothetical protein
MPLLLPPFPAAKRALLSAASGKQADASIRRRIARDRWPFPQRLATCDRLPPLPIDAISSRSLGHRHPQDHSIRSRHSMAAASAPAKYALSRRTAAGASRPGALPEAAHRLFRCRPLPERSPGRRPSPAALGPARHARIRCCILERSTEHAASALFLPRLSRSDRHRTPGTGRSCRGFRIFVSVY